MADENCENGVNAILGGQLVISTAPNVMIMPLERSMPAVRMINVWPMASVPTTMVCCTIRERL